MEFAKVYETCNLVFRAVCRSLQQCTKAPHLLRSYRTFLPSLSCIAPISFDFQGQWVTISTVSTGRGDAFEIETAALRLKLKTNILAR